MQLNKKIKLISLVIILSIVFLGIIVFNSKVLNKQSSPPPNDPIGKAYGVNKMQTDKAFLEINDTKYEGDIEREISVYDFMSELRKKGEINFTEKNYVGMGKLITAINGISNNSEKSWIYYVNGIEAQVGVSNYKIKKGDIVSWKYEKYE